MYTNITQKWKPEAETTTKSAAERYSAQDKQFQPGMTGKTCTSLYSH